MSGKLPPPPSPPIMAGKQWFSGTLWEAAVNLSGLAATASKAKGPVSPGPFRSRRPSHWPALSGNHWGRGILGEEPCFFCAKWTELRRKGNDVISTRDRLVQGRSQLTLGYSPVCAVPSAGPTHTVSVNQQPLQERASTHPLLSFPPPHFIIIFLK